MLYRWVSVLLVTEQAVENYNADSGDRRCGAGAAGPRPAISVIRG